MTERSQQSRGNWKKFCDTLQKEIRMQTEVWTLLDGGSRLYYQNKNMNSCMKQGLGGS
jgi:hypothetical protein